MAKNIVDPNVKKALDVIDKTFFASGQFKASVLKTLDVETLRKINLAAGQLQVHSGAVLHTHFDELSKSYSVNIDLPKVEVKKPAKPVKKDVVKKDVVKKTEPSSAIPVATP